MAKHVKTLILSIDITGGPEWQVRAMQMQMKAWLNKNKVLQPNEDLIILPTKGETKLFWLEGQPPKDLTELESIKDRIQPVLEIALDLKIDRSKKYVNPFKSKNL